MVKTEGVVVKFNNEKGFGFLRSKKFSDDIFVHIRDVQGRTPLMVGQEAIFNVSKSNKGLLATDVVPGKMQMSPQKRYGIAAAVLTAILAIYMLWDGASFSAINYYYFAINWATFLFFAYDKIISNTKMLRVPESILVYQVLAGGIVGGFIGQIVFRHKIRKDAFRGIYHVAIFAHIMLWVAVGCTISCYLR